jgi:hypothetical protein
MQSDCSVAATKCAFSVLSSRNLTFGFYVGQLDGSSGGIPFLAEFIITTINLFLGGAGTVSATTFESWFFFLLLALTSFAAYLVACVAIIESFREKKRTFSMIILRMLLVSILVALFLGVTCLRWLWWHIGGDDFAI